MLAPVGMMKPVLLKDETKLEEMTNDGWTAELKYDGYGTQCIVEDGKARFYARSPAAVAGVFTDYTLHVPHLVQDIQGAPDGYYFGELYIPGMESAKLGTLHGDPEKTHALMKKFGEISFVIYDHITGIDDKTIYSDRRNKIIKTVDSVNNKMWSASRVLVGVEIDKAINQMRQGKIEGLVLKKNNSTYYASTKSRSRSCWKKVKAVHTDDVVVFGAIQGQGKYDGMVGALSVGKYVNGEAKILTTVSGFTDAQRRDFEKRLTKEGEGWVADEPFTIEIAFMEKTHLGGYRHPRYIRFRPDKTPGECSINATPANVKTLDQF